MFALSLKALYESNAKAGSQIRVLSIGLMASAPSGITKDVHIRSPVGQSLIDVRVAFLLKFIVFCPAFRRYGIRHTANRLLVKHGRQPDGLWKHGSGTASGHAVQTLVPPVVGRYLQPRYRGRVVAHLGGHLLHRHLFHQFHCFLPCFLSVHRFLQIIFIQKSYLRFFFSSPHGCGIIAS